MKIELDYFVGVDIPERNREVWAQQVYNDLTQSKISVDFSYRCSGNAIVFGVRDSENQVDIYDCRIERMYDRWLDEDQQMPGGLFTF